MKERLTARISLTLSAILITLGAGQVFPVASGGSAAGVVPSTAPLLQASDLVYSGAFRLPAPQSDEKSFEYGGDALAYNPARNTLMAVTGSPYQHVAEITIPAVRNNVLSIAALDRATLAQSYTDVLGGHRRDMGQFSIGGLLPLNDRLIVSVFVAYDTSGKTSLSHFKTGLDFLNLGIVRGPFQVGDGQAGFVGGYMAPIPAEWRSALGGPALTGQCCLSIIGRTSHGPSASVFDPTWIAEVSPVPAARVFGYPAAHPTLGRCDGIIFNCASHVNGVVFPAATRSVLFFGTLGSNYCYGEGTKSPSLAGTTSKPGGPQYCYDPTDSGKGDHGYPYAQHVWAYDANDLAAVKAGTKTAWDVLPYATWTFSLPFETAARRIRGATYDPATRRVFLSVYGTDGHAPLIHVYTLLSRGKKIG